MKRVYHLLGLIAVAVALMLSFPRSAHAYVDPGTGSYVLQIIIASIAAATFTLKLYWGRIRAYFSSAPPEEENTESDE
jgi:hypothetical protein